VWEDYYLAAEVSVGRLILRAAGVTVGRLLFSGVCVGRLLFRPAGEIVGRSLFGDVGVHVRSKSQQLIIKRVICPEGYSFLKNSLMCLAQKGVFESHRFKYFCLGR
jgi:hypothetical protein